MSLRRLIRGRLAPALVWLGVPVLIDFFLIVGIRAAIQRRRHPPTYEPFAEPYGDQ